MDSPTRDDLMTVLPADLKDAEEKIPEPEEEIPDEDGGSAPAL